MTGSLPASLDPTIVTRLHDTLTRTQQFLVSLDGLLREAADFADSPSARLVLILYHQRVGLNAALLAELELETTP
tara:strand:- start:37885 stop:38109 length:225 start_codon:yes stop_codon:yes gene_type:complete